MNAFTSLSKRNIAMFFKDKGMFFTSLITPAILLVLYATFLSNIYRSSFTANLPEGFSLGDSIVNGAVAGQLFSSLIAVSCITVAFCSNFLMVQDKVTGAYKDFSITPLKKSVLSYSYYVAAFLSTLTVTLFACAVCFIYVAIVGWYLSFSDVLLIISDVLILTMFGTALSSVVNFFLNTQGQVSAVGAIVSAGYGFICGAYIPISQFSKGLADFVMFLPGTYGTSLIRNHCMSGVFEKMASEGVPQGAINAMRDSIDCNLYFFGTEVQGWVSYAVILGAVALFVGLYVILNLVKKKNK